MALQKTQGDILLKKYVSVWYIFDLVVFVNCQRPRNNLTLKFNKMTKTIKLLEDNRNFKAWSKVFQFFRRLLSSIQKYNTLYIPHYEVD
jgi:hypothetical protein